MSFWYLATPYENYPGGTNQAFLDAVRNAAILAREGIPVFCPIAHGHHMHPHINPTDAHKFWLDFDQPFMDAACGLIVCKLEGWSQSRGIRVEQDYFAAIKKPVVFMDAERVPWELAPVGGAAPIMAAAKSKVPAAINPKDAAAQCSGRTELGLLSPVFKESVARVMMHGAYKSPRADGTRGYGPYNWRDQPVKLSTYLDATERHIEAIRRGEWIDTDSSLPHAAHIGANANILLDATNHGTLEDNLKSKDRYNL